MGVQGLNRVRGKGKGKHPHPTAFDDEHRANSQESRATQNWNSRAQNFSAYIIDNGELEFFNPKRIHAYNKSKWKGSY
jgi:hypothetical protein